MMARLAQRLRPVRRAAPDPAVAGSADDTLEAFDVTVHFEGLAAVDGVSIAMRHGEVFGLIGPNGAGKTTLVNVLTGFQRPTRGRVVLGGEDVTGLSPHALGRKGLARTFQAVRLFRDMPVIDNLEAAAVGTGLGRREAARRAARILAWMRFAHRADDWADTLPLWRGAPRRDRPRPRHGAPLRAAGRACGGLERCRVRRADGADRRDPPRLRLRRAADRAQHGGSSWGRATAST